MRNDRLERPAVQRQQRAILLVPAEPRRGERKGGERRDADHFVGREAAHQHGPDAEEERIAAREHANGLAAMGLDRVERVLDRRRPDERLGGQRPGEREMALAADHELGLRDEPPRGRREAVDPVLPDADDSEPAFLGHGAVA